MLLLFGLSNVCRVRLKKSQNIKHKVIESQTKSIASWKEEQHLTLVEIAGSKASY